MIIVAQTRANLKKSGYHVWRKILTTNIGNITTMGNPKRI